MNLLTSIFTVVHLVAAIAIVVLVLLQQGKGADMGAAFGVIFQLRVWQSGLSDLLEQGSPQDCSGLFVTGLSLAYIYTSKGCAAERDGWGEYSAVLRCSKRCEWGCSERGWWGSVGYPLRTKQQLAFQR